MTTDRIERLLRLIQRLQTYESCTAGELAEWLGVHKRTVFRDLDLLREAGLQYDYEREEKRYSARHHSALPPVSLEPGEALSLLFLIRQAIHGRMMPDPGTAAAAAMKIESMLPQALQDYCGPLLEQIEIMPPQASDPQAISDTLTTLQQALARRQKVAIAYDSYNEGGLVEDTLHPYRLVFLKRGWYLLACSQRHGDVRTYKIERMARLEVLDEVFTPDPGFSLERYFRNAWLMIPGDRRYHVRIRFSPQVAANVEEVIWHKTQVTYREENEALIFEVDVDGLAEISWWILGYGDQAEVLEPPELRTLIRQRIEDMLRVYQGAG